jgi:hypothetical protein
MLQNQHPSTDDLRERVRSALQQWRQDGVNSSPLQHLHLFRRVQRSTHSHPHAATNQLLLQLLKTLETQHPVEAQLLRQRFYDGELAYTVAHRASLGESTFYRKQNEAIRLLADCIQNEEECALAEYQRHQEQRLPAPSYLRLIGVDEHLEQLAVQVVQPDPPWLVLISGIGGIGKSSLVNALARHLLVQRHDYEVGWVTAQQQLYHLGGAIQPMEAPALTAQALVEALFGQLWGDAVKPSTYRFQDLLQALIQKLKMQPHLIFIDNLETVRDVEGLLPMLRRLANPSRFVLTSRQNLFAEPDIFHFSLPELTPTQALELIRAEAWQRNLPQVLAASDEELSNIWGAVGGNPLALRLVAGQMHIHSLEIVLRDLRSAASHKVDAFYTYIYWQAWEELNELERNVLLVMPMTSEEGGTTDFLAAVSQLSLVDLRAALERLVILSLVDSRGDLNHRRFSIHNLTRTFLHQQVAKWRSTHA